MGMDSHANSFLYWVFAYLSLFDSHHPLFFIAPQVQYLQGLAEFFCFEFNHVRGVTGCHQIALERL